MAETLREALEWYASGDDGQRARDALDASGREHLPRRVEYDEGQGRYHCGVCGIAVHRVGTGTGWGHSTALAVPERATPAIDRERLMDAEHRWCVELEGEWALGHPVTAHAKQADFVIAALAASPDPRHE